MANFTEKFIEELDGLENLISQFPDSMGGSIQGSVPFDPRPSDKATYLPFFWQLRRMMGEEPNSSNCSLSLGWGGFMGFTFEDFFYEEPITIDILKKIFTKFGLNQILVSDCGQHYLKILNANIESFSNWYIFMSAEGISDDIYKGMKLVID